MIIDTHCHYNAEPILTDIKNQWQHSLDAQVVGAICVGTDLTNSQVSLDLAQKFPGMFAAIGIHPEEYTQENKTLWKNNTLTQKSPEEQINKDSKKFSQLLEFALHQENKKIVAVGEIGLDYYRLKAKGEKREYIEKIQKQIFKNQLVLAFQHNLAVILHVRDLSDRTEKNAYYDTYSIVAELVNQYHAENKPIPTIVLHCASGPEDYIQNFINLGAYIGFAGNITYENASNLKKIFESIPEDRVLLETDAPYLAPSEKKGKICQPYFITQTALFLQNTYNLDLDIILANTLNAFPQFQKVVQ